MKFWKSAVCEVTKGTCFRLIVTKMTWPTFSEYVHRCLLWCHKERRADRGPPSQMFVWLLKIAHQTPSKHVEGPTKFQYYRFWWMAANRRLKVLVSLDLKGLTEVLDENEHNVEMKLWWIAAFYASCSFPHLGSAVGCTFSKIYEYTQRIQQVKWKSVYMYKKVIHSPKAKWVSWCFIVN